MREASLRRFASGLSLLRDGFSSTEEFNPTSRCVPKMTGSDLSDACEKNSSCDLLVTIRRCGALDGFQGCGRRVPRGIVRNPIPQLTACYLFGQFGILVVGCHGETVADTKLSSTAKLLSRTSTTIEVSFERVGRASFSLAIVFFPLPRILCRSPRLNSVAFSQPRSYVPESPSWNRMNL